MEISKHKSRFQAGESSSRFQADESSVILYLLHCTLVMSEKEQLGGCVLLF